MSVRCEHIPDEDVQICIGPHQARDRTAVRSARLAWSLRAPVPPFIAFLALVGCLVLAAYSGSCDARGRVLVRYALLALFIPVAVAAWHLHVEPRPAIRRVMLVLRATWILWSAAQSAVVIRHYVQQPPETARSRLAAELERRGITHGRAEYRTAHPITFLTGERVRLASEPLRILVSEVELAREHRQWSIEGAPCVNGVQVEQLCICE